MPTIFDVAKSAGVGVGTVSRVINNSPHVSDATRARVMAAIEELDYRPSSVARSLVLGRSNTVSVIAYVVTEPSVMERLAGILDVLRDTEHEIVLYNVTTPEERSAYFEATARKDRSGSVIIISLHPSHDDIARYRRADIPVVLVDMDPAHDVPGVTIDNVDGGRMAADYLIDLGHRRIAYLGATEDFDFGDWTGDNGDNPPNMPLSYRGGRAVSASAERRVGYEAALTAAGIAVDPSLIKLGAHGAEAGEELTDELLDLDEPPTAVFAASDLQAIGVIEAARRRGVRVPEDLSVIGFDDLRVAHYMGLTTVRQPLYESGVIGARKILALLDTEQDEPGSDTLRLEVVERRSTAKPARS